MRIRPAVLTDAPAVSVLYAAHVLTGTASFEITPPDAEEMARRMKAVLDLILKTGCTAVDPIEPAPQGDVTLAEVREKTGGKLVLFGNLEISDIEQLSPDEMEKKVLTAIQESGGSRFVLMPSASPYGRKLSPLTLANYTRIVETVENYRY